MLSNVLLSTTMGIEAYQDQAKLLVKHYLLAEPFIPYTSIIGCIFLCKLLYDISIVVTPWYFKGYAGLTKIQCIEWSNRVISTIHAIFISVMSLYLVFFSDLYSDNRSGDLITVRSSPLSDFAMGVSVGYFLSDLGMIIWLYPSLGGMEYVVHHLLSVVAVAYSLLYRQGQIYTYMVLISEITTPGVNLRWYLDTAGMKRSKAYLINGIMMFFAWLVARILLFGYLFYHVYLHYMQVKQMPYFGFCLVFGVPSILAIMNLMWFAKILKGLKKTLTKRH